MLLKFHPANINESVLINGFFCYQKIIFEIVVKFCREKGSDSHVKHSFCNFLFTLETNQMILTSSLNLLITF